MDWFLYDNSLRHERVKGASTEKPYQELGLEYLQNRRWFRKLCIFYKIVTEQPPKYLFDLNSSNNNTCEI